MQLQPKYYNCNCSQSTITATAKYFIPNCSQRITITSTPVKESTITATTAKQSTITATAKYYECNCSQKNTTTPIEESTITATAVNGSTVVTSLCVMVLFVLMLYTACQCLLLIIFAKGFNQDLDLYCLTFDGIHDLIF